MTRILVFGDSITAGSYDHEEGGWVNRLRKFLDVKVLTESKFSYRIYNLGISGDTTEGLLHRLESEAKNRIKETEDNVIIFQIGLNDSILILDKGKLITSSKKFSKNIQKLVKISSKITKNIIFVGLTPVNESKVVPIPWRREAAYKNEHIRKYDYIIKEVCNKNNVKFVEMFQEIGKVNYYDKLLEDGVHPNSEGHQKMFEIIKDFLIDNKMI